MRPEDANWGASTKPCTMIMVNRALNRSVKLPPRQFFASGEDWTSVTITKEDPGACFGPGVLDVV